MARTPTQPKTPSARIDVGKHLLALALLVAAGCSAPNDVPSIPKPGSGIAEYRQVARQSHAAVAGVVDALDALATDPKLARFDRAFEQLELTSVKARARAEAIIARGQNYFDEWKEQLGTNHFGGASSVEPLSKQTERYDRLFDHFTRIRQRSGEVRQEFRPFMASLRQFRARLDQPSTSSPRQFSRAEIDVLTASGRDVLKALESVSEALDHAEVELRALQASKR